MNTYRTGRVLPSLLALALPAMLVNCSSSSSSPAVVAPAAPTVAISGTSSTTATGPVTLTFTFSQPMTAFPASAVLVTGGTKGATAMTDATHFTLVVTPTANAAGTMQISIAAGAFMDAAGVANTVAASASQTYNTVPAPVAPTVAITGTSGTTATGPVTLTFTFSQPMTTFTASDVTVTGGTASATTAVDTTHYTLVATPLANSTGTMTITVAAGAFMDTAGLANTVAATASQAYDTTSVVATSYTVLDFNTTLATGYAYLNTDFNGEASSFTSTSIPSGAPAGGPLFLMATVPPGTTVTSGTTLSIGGSQSIGALPFYAAGGTTPQATTMTMVVYAPAAGLPIELKAENALNAGQSVETHANTTAAGWQTLTFDFTNNVMPNGLPTAALAPGITYDKLSVFPAFLTSPTANEVFYFGPITFVGETGPSAPALPPVVAPASPATAAPTPTVAAAKVIALYNSTGTYPDFSVNTWSAGWGSDVETTYAIPSTSSTVLEYSLLQYAGVQIPASFPSTPTTGLLDISTMTTMHVDLWTPNGTQFGIQLVSFSGGAANNTGVNQILFTSATITQNGWVSLEIPLTSFTTFSGTEDLTSIGQILWLDNTGGTENGTFYLDNIYFHK